MKSLFKISLAALMLSQLEASYYDNQNNVKGGWDFNVDFLWWEITEDSLPAIIVIDEIDDNTSSARVHNPHFKWDPGVRLGLGYQPCGCDWDIFATWTYFNTKAKHHFALNDPDVVIVPQWGSLLPFIASDADLNSHWHLNLNWADLQLNQTISENSCFSFDIHGGLRAVFINQKFHFSSSSTFASNTLHAKNKFSSIGIVLGLDASWDFGRCVSINIGGGGALLYGRTHSSFSETLTVTDIDFLSGSAHDHLTRAMSDLRIGISWEYEFNGCMPIIFGLDWEHHILFNQNQLPRGSSTASARPRDGDITMQGLTFSFSFMY